MTTFWRSSQSLLGWYHFVGIGHRHRHTKKRDNEYKKQAFIISFSNKSTVTKVREIRSDDGLLLVEIDQ